ncbi:MAG: hypothetical protein JWO38_3951 [Gemmataceae bacterium]|nr:hypothetical protein [Gemmataceae bacterium]
MTQTSADLGLSAAAEARLAEYLVQVRAALTGVPDVSPDEVEADIREHVENELRTAIRPVALFVLEAVLKRLGPPTQWLPAGRAAPPAEVPSLLGYLRHRARGVVGALWRGPEDWRLPYLSFAVFALGVVAFPLFPLFLIVSYFLSRAGIAVAKEKQIPIDAGRKWLLYPPVVIVGLVLLLGLTLLAPLGVTIAVCGNAVDADQQERWELAGQSGLAPRFRDNTALMKRYPAVVTTLDRLLIRFPGNRTTKEVGGALFVGAGAFAAWGAVIGLLGARFPGSVRAVFDPLCGPFEGRGAGRVGLTCLLLLAVWCGFAVRILVDAGLV